MRSLRWLIFFGCAAIAFGALGYTVANAQAVEKIPDGELPEGVKSAGDFAPQGWDGSGTHPGKADFDTFCSACHNLNEVAKIGPGFAGLYDRVTKGPAHDGKPVQQRLLEFIKETRTGGPENYSKDPYFKSVQETSGGAGVQMQTRGGLPESATDRRILDIIDYILRFRQPTFSEEAYLKQVKLGKELVSGARPFKWGAPSCTGCHTIGAEHDLRGANVGGNVAHTYVLARQRGVDEKSNFADGLQDILGGEDAPPAHYWYKDGEGSHPLTEVELVAVNTFFEQAARETGTERDSNYLPIFALLLAALGIVLLEPGVLNILFVKEDHEYIDGPYAEEEHHHDDHAGDEKDHGAENAKTVEEPDEPKPAEPRAEDKPDESPEASTESAGTSDADVKDEATAEAGDDAPGMEEKPEEKPTEEAANDSSDESVDEAASEADKGDAASDDSANDDAEEKK
ncbi:MAG: hypothetical protein R3E76_12060 [Planctomycetota bacterium]